MKYFTLLLLLGTTTASAAECTVSVLRDNKESIGVTLDVNDTIANRTSVLREYLYTVVEKSDLIVIQFMNAQRQVVALASGPSNTTTSVSLYAPSRNEYIGLKCKQSR